jgi:hypothetical protein
MACRTRQVAATLAHDPVDQVINRRLHHRLSGGGNDLVAFAVGFDENDPGHSNSLPRYSRWP